jgi:hypothetical protein
LFIDACRVPIYGLSANGSFIKNNSQKKLPPQGMAIFFASDVNQTSYIDPELGYGYFSKHLLAGLEGLADESEDGKLTADELQSFVNDNVKNNIEKDRDSGKNKKLAGAVQTPILLVKKEKGGFLLYEPKISQAKLSIPETRISDQTFRETNFWNSIKNGEDYREFNAYLKKYCPGGEYCELAELRYEKLKPINKKITPKVGSKQAQLWNQKGEDYYYGEKGVSQDYEEAVKWYRKSAEQGNANGQNELGLMYDKGNGVAQDYEKAMKWYRKSAEQGLALGQYNLGILYAKGKGVSQDYEEAVKWFRKSARQGDANGQASLGYMYENGNSVTRDYDEAVKWYRKSAKQGLARGQYNLGNMYQNGNGVPKEISTAIRLYREAANQDYENAIKALKRLENN